MLEAGTVQSMLAHNDIATTIRYHHVARQVVSAMKSAPRHPRYRRLNGGHIMGAAALSRGGYHASPRRGLAARARLDVPTAPRRLDDGVQRPTTLPSKRMRVSLMFTSSPSS
jgi:hypothetical protein